MGESEGFKVKTSVLIRSARGGEKSNLILFEERSFVEGAPDAGLLVEKYWMVLGFYD